VPLAAPAILGAIIGGLPMTWVPNVWRRSWKRRSRSLVAPEDYDRPPYGPADSAVRGGAR